ncbi:MAG: hypothetical protein ACR2NP_14840 [Pirellulaceae bacterium]
MDRHQYGSCLNRTHDALGIRFPVSYVNRGVLYSLVDHQGVPVGGAIVVLEPPFRSLAAIPGVRTATRADAMQAGSVAEINGLWLCDRTRGLCASFNLWTQLLNKLLDTSCEQFLFTYDNANKQMAGLMKWAQPEVLYSGRTRQLPGMKSAAEETIAAASRRIVDSMLRFLGNPRSTVEPIATAQDHALRKHSLQRAA